jgi:hypothetical protein
MRIGNIGCGFGLMLLTISMACLLALLPSGCMTTEWSVIHEGVLIRADVSAGQSPYLNVSFEDGFTIPLYYGYFEHPVGWTTGTRYRLEERMEDSWQRYCLSPIVPLEAEAEPSYPK